MLIRMSALSIAVFFSGASFAQQTEGYDGFQQGPSPALDVSPECIISALQKTFGQSADISADIPGSVSAMTLDGYNMSLGEVVLDEANRVIGVSATMRIGANRNAPAPQGTAYLDYTYNGDIGYHLIGGLDTQRLYNYVTALDRELRSCATAPAPLVG